MIKNVLTHIGGIEIYGILSVLLFFTVFTATLFWALRLKKTHLDAMARLPLHDGTTDSLPPISKPSQPDSSHE